MRIPSFVVLVLAALACVLGAAAFDVTSEFINLRVTNGSVVIRERTITFQCDKTDFGFNRTFTVLAPNGSSTSLVVECTKPRIDFDLYPVGFVPPSCRSFIRQVCLLHDTSGIEETLENEFEPSADTLPLPPNAKKVMSMNKQYDRSTKRRWTPKRHSAFSTSANSSPASNATHFGPQVEINPVKGFVCTWTGNCGSNDDSWRDPFNKLKKKLSALEARENDTVTKFDAFFRDLIAVNDQQNNVIANLSSSIVTVSEVLASQGNQFALVNETVAETARMLQQVTAGFGQSIGDLRTDVSALQSQISGTASSLSTFVNITDTALKNLVIQMNNANADINQQFGESIDRVWDRITSVYMSVVSAQRDLKTIAASLRREASGEVFKRPMTEMLRDAVDKVNGLGPDYEAMLENVGLDPADPYTNELAWRTPITSNRIFHATNPSLTSGGVTQATEHRFDVYCSTRSLVQSMPTIESWIDFMQHIGPNNCDESNPTTNCTCWVSYRKFFCNTTEALMNTTNFSSTVTALSSRTSVCTAGSVSSTSPEPITSPASVITRLASICSVGMNTGFHNRYMVYSTTMQSYMRAPFSSSFCASAETLIADALEQDQRSGTTLVYTMAYPFFLMIEIAFGLWEKAWPELSALVIGEMPQRASFTEQPMVRVYSNERGDLEMDYPTNATNTRREGRCLTATFAACVTEPEELVPVYRISKTAEIATVRVFYNGQVNTYTTSVTFNDGGAGLTPNEVLIIGSPTSSVEIYDAPYNELSVGGEPLRRDTATYFLTPYEDGDPDTPQVLSASAFFEREGVRIDHNSAQVSPEDYLVGIMPNGTCITSERRAFHGTLCRFRDVYEVSTLFDVTRPGAVGVKYFNATTRSNSPYDASFTATVTIPEGQLLNSFTTACPVWTLTQMSDIGFSLALTNAQGTATVYYKLTRDGDCCGRTWEGQLEPSEGTAIWIPTCSNTVGLCHTATPTIAIARKTFTPNPDSTELCSTVSIVLNATEFVNRTGIATARTLDYRSISQTDETVVGMNAVVASLAQSMIQLAKIMIEDKLETSTPAGINLQSNLSDWAISLGLLMRNITSSIDASRNRTDFDYLSALAAYNARISSLQEQYEASANESASLLSNLTAQLNTTAQAEALLAVITALFVNSTRALNESLYLANDAKIAFRRDLVNFLEILGEVQEGAFSGSMLDSIGAIGASLGKMLDPNLGDELDDLIGTAIDLGNGVIDITEDMVKNVKDAVKDLKNALKDLIPKNPLDMLGDLIGEFLSVFLSVFLIAALAVGLLVGVPKLVSYLRSKGMCGGKKQDAAPQGIDAATWMSIQTYISAEVARQTAAIKTSAGAVQTQPSAVEMSGVRPKQVNSAPPPTGADPIDGDSDVGSDASSSENGDGVPMMGTQTKRRCIIS